MMSALDTFRPLFRPQSIAVVGASANAVAGGNRFIRHVKAYGYKGQIYPIHPTATRIEDLTSYRSACDLPEVVDYAYVAVAAPRVPAVLRALSGRARVAQVMSSGFGETGGGQALQEEIGLAAHEAGLRVIGPNCLGVYSPRGGVTFTERTSPDPGRIGVVCQSGGLGIDLLRRGQIRGLRFSGLVTIGNCADVQASELVEYFIESPDTSVIGLYLESARDGRRLFEVLKAGNARKPVVLLKGGRTQQGQRAAASHTGALSAGFQGWGALSKQTGAVQVDSLDSMIDALLALQCLQLCPKPTRRVVLFGNGGGTSVLGTDAFVDAGMEVGRFEPAMCDALDGLGLPAGSSVLNPIDVPAGALQEGEGRIAERIISEVQRARAADAIVIHINMTVVMSFRHVDMLGNLINAALRATNSGRSGAHISLVLRSDGDADVEDLKRTCRARALESGIPVFDELIPASRALAAVAFVETFRWKRRQTIHEEQESTE